MLGPAMLIASFFLIIGTAESISLNLKARLQDKKGMETDLMYEYGRLTITCEISGQCEENDQIEFVRKEPPRVLHSAGCGPGDTSVSFESSISISSLGFGSVSCRHKRTGVWSNSLPLRYRICWQYSKECTYGSSYLDTRDNPFGDNPLFCVRTGRDVITNFADIFRHPYTPIADSYWCGLKIPGNNICPANRETLCETFAYREYDKAFFRWPTPGSCPNVTRSPLTYQGKPIRYRQPFAMYKQDRSVTLECPRGGPFYDRFVSFTIFYWDAVYDYVHEFQQNVTCRDSATFTLPEKLFLYKSKNILGISIPSPNDPHKMEYLFENTLILFVWTSWCSLAGSVTVTKNGEWLDCATSSTGDGFGEFIWWTKNETGDKVGPILRPHDPGEYQCHATMFYGTCDPHQRLVYNGSSQWVVIEPDTSTTSGSTSGRPQDYVVDGIVILVFCYTAIPTQCTL